MQNKNNNIFCIVSIMVAAVLFSVLVQAGESFAYTTQQIKMVEQLSDSEKARLAASAGIELPGELKSQSTQSSEPLVVPPRVLENSVLESKMQEEAAPDNVEVDAAHAGMGINTAKITSQRQGEDVEIRKAFADVAQDSSPLKVPTDIKQFGYELFAGNPDTFAPATDIPVPSEYVLGPGDEIKVHLYGRADKEFNVVVDREGEMAFPSLGALSVSGLTFVEAKAMIAQEVKKKLVGVTADVSMGKLRSIRVFALGDVVRPGSYTVSGLSTISHALFVSGGIKKTGSLRNIQLKRHGKVITSIDLYDFLLQGDTSKDVRLLPGDVVFVPPIGVTVGVAGQVLRPAIYELKKQKNVYALLAMAGGLSPRAYKKMALIERIDRAGGESTIKISLENLKAKIGLQNGDFIKIFSVTNYENNPVYLVGHVKRPGKYAWHENMTLTEILPSLDDLLPEAKLDYAVIERETGVNREATMLHFNLRDILEGRQSLSLQSRDKVYIFARANLRQLPVVKISGSVQNPGSFEMKKNMRLIDLLMVAGGVRRGADLENVELFRLDPQTNKTVTSKYSIATIHSDNVSQTKVGEEGGDKIYVGNPLLHDLDEVVIHSINEKFQKFYVHISGEINHPGEYILGEDMHLSDLVFTAGNVTEKAYMKVAEVTRYEIMDDEKRQVHHFPVNLFDALQGNKEADILLEPYDVITVRQISNWRSIEHVIINGEVIYPGSYPIEEGELLSSVLKRAGGFTARAFLSGAVFVRKTILEDQQKKLAQMTIQVEEDIALQVANSASLTDPKLIAKQQASVSSAKQILTQMRQAKATGRLVINLKDISVLQGTEFDLTLRDGDRLVIPKKPNEILVMGQVYNNTALLYNSNFNWKDYLQMAGGVTRQADKSHIYVMRITGMVERVKGGWKPTMIGPGDVIVVPQDLNKTNLVDSALDWSKVLYQLGVAIASMQTIGIL